MGEAGMHDTPLHIACKNASIEIVKLFVSYPQIQINKHNKLGLTPSQTIGTNLESISKLLDLEVRNALEGQVVITLLQKGECEQPKLLISPLKADLTEEASESDNNSNICQNDYSVNKSGESKKSNNFANGKMKSPYKRAQLGPLSPSMAKEIKQIWAMSRSTKSNPTLNHLLEDKSSDISKGFESVGRYLAKQNKFKWLEYWSMLDMDIDIGSEDGLNQLDNYFVNKISKYVIQDFLDSVHLLSQKAELDDITINKQPGIQMNLITNNSDNLTFNSPANRDNFVPIEKERLNIEFPTLGDREFQTFSPLDDNTKTAQQNQQQMSPLMSGMNILYEELLSKYTPNSNFQQQKQHKQELDLCFDVPCSKFDSVYSQSESDLSLYADKTLVSVLNRNIMKHRSVLNDIIKQIVSKITNMANFVVNDILFDIKITHVGYSTHPRQKLVNITKNRVINCNNNFDNNCTISGKLTASLITNKNISSSVIIISEPYKYEIIGAHLNLEEDLSSGLSPSPSQFGFHSYETDVCSIIFNLPTLQHKDFFIENFEFSKQDQDVMKALVYSDISTINSLPFVYDWYRRISMKN
ncbi:MAG: Ankyrin repeat and LEM, variant 2 [Marteilia pararefringens]